MRLFVFPCFCLPKDRHHQTIKYGWKTFVCSAQITALLLLNAHWNDGMGSGVWGLRVFTTRVSALPELFQHLYSQDGSCTFRFWLFFTLIFHVFPFVPLFFSLFFSFTILKYIIFYPLHNPGHIWHTIRTAHNNPKCGFFWAEMKGGKTHTHMQCRTRQLAL